MSASVSRRAKLTQAEKLARKKQFAEEKKLKRIEQEKQSLRDELAREIQYTRQSRITLDQHWEDICGEMTKTTLLDNLKDLQQNVNRIFDKKEEATQQMRRWREEAEAQYKRLLNGHLDVIEYLMSNATILR